MDYHKSDKIDENSNVAGDSISASDLKKLTKFVITEIAPNKKFKKSKGFFHDVISSLQAQQQTHPIARDLKVARDTSDKLLLNMKKYVNIMIESVAKKAKEEYNNAFYSFNYSRGDLLDIVSIWARRINSEDDTKLEELNTLMEDLKTHIIEIGNQTNEIAIDIKKYQNYINAIKKVRHLNEIFKQLQIDTKALFDMAESLGLGTEKEGN